MLAMPAPSEIPDSSTDVAMQPRTKNGPRKLKKMSEEMMGAGTGTTAAQFPSEDSGWKPVSGPQVPNTWNKKKGKSMKNESLDEAYVPKAKKLKFAATCGFHTRFMEHHAGNIPVRAEFHSRKAARAALAAGLPVTNPKTTSNKDLSQAFQSGYAKATAKITGIKEGTKGPLDAREHVFGFIKESTNESQESTMNINEVLSKITSGEITAQEAAQTMANELIERGLKPRALQRFVAWGKEGNERRTRRLLPGGQNAEYQAANGPHLGESEESEEQPEVVAELTEDALEDGILGEAVIHKEIDLSQHKKLASAGTFSYKMGSDTPYELEALHNDSTHTGDEAEEAGVKYVFRTKTKEHAQAFHSHKQKHSGVLTPIEKHGAHYVFGYGDKHKDDGAHAADMKNVSAAREARNKEAAKAAAKLAKTKKIKESADEQLDEKGATKANTKGLAHMRFLVRQIRAVGPSSPEAASHIKTLKDVHGVDFHALSKGK
jgi:hypothetical protein